MPSSFNSPATLSRIARIDFHSNVSNPLDYAGGLIRTALASQCKLIVRHQDENQLAQFDQLLWEFSATDFLPHVALNPSNLALAQQTPVLLTLASDIEIINLLLKAEKECENLHNEMLINLSNTVPDNFAQFEHLIEIIPQETELTRSATQAGR
jgi:DNA polymerase-3 subunit chi